MPKNKILTDLDVAQTVAALSPGTIFNFQNGNGDKAYIKAPNGGCTSLYSGEYFPSSSNGAVRILKAIQIISE